MRLITEKGKQRQLLDQVSELEEEIREKEQVAKYQSQVMLEKIKELKMMEEKNKQLLMEVADFKETAQNEMKKREKQASLQMSTP